MGYWWWGEEDAEALMGTLYMLKLAGETRLCIYGNGT